MQSGHFRTLFSRVLLAAVVFLTAGFALHAEEADTAKPDAAQKKKVKRIPLRLMTLPDPKATDPSSKAELAVFKAFRKKYPHIELSSFSGISIQGMADESKMTLAIAGDNAPDVWSYINFRMSDTYIQQGFLYPLDEFIERDWKDGMKGFLNDVPAPIRPVMRRAGPGIGGHSPGEHVWGVSGALSVRVLMWRKDRFQEAGLDPSKPPKDWSELLEYSRKLSDPERKRFGMNMTSGKQAAWDFMAFLWSAGGEAVKKNENGEWVAAFGDRKSAEALEFYIRLATEKWVDAEGKTQRGYTVLSSSDVNGDEAWREGRVGMTVQYLDSRTMGGDIDAALVGIGPFPPVREGESSGTELNAIMAGIFAKISGRRNSEGEWCSADEIREAAWQFIRFAYSDEGGKIRADELVANGMGRTLSPDWLKKYGYWDEYGKYLTPGLADVFEQAVKNGKPEPYGRNCQLVYFYMTYPIDDVRQWALNDELPSDYGKRVDVIQKRLESASEKTTKEMIGRLTPDERSFRNKVAAAVAMVICGIICFAIYRIWQIFSPKDSYTGKRRGWEFRKNGLGYAIMIPALLSLLIWIYYPMFSGSALLFQDYRVAGGSVWTGFDNLADVLFSPDWWRSVYNTLRYMVLILALGFIAPIVLAILLQEVSHAKIVYRTLYYLPAVMSGLVVIYMWRLFYQSGPTGILNQVVQTLTDGINYVLVPVGSLFDPSYTGITFEPLRWLEDSRWAMLACVIPTVWASAGPGCLIYLAALKGVPDDIYEAAEIDGANFFQKIWHVTLPTLKALIIINFVGAFIGAAQSGGMILIMTFGQANTEVAELHIFKEAYTNLKFGTAIAMAWILGISTLLFTIYQLKKLSNMEFKTTGK